MAREPLWPRLEPYIRAHQPPGYTAPHVEGENDQAHLYHSPLREDKHPSFVIWHDTPTKPGGYYDRATGEGGNLYQLLQRLAAEEHPECNGRDNDQVRVETRRLQTMAEFCAERKLDPVALATAYGVHEVVDEKSRRPALEYPTPLGVNRRKFLDGQKHKKYSWDPPGGGGTSHWYGLPQAAKIGGTTLFVVNGAPAVWACHAAGVPAICYEGGEGKTPTAEDVQYLRGALDHWTSFRQLRVIYDVGEAHDRPGRGSRAVAAALRKGRIGATAYGLPVDLGKGGDVDDLHRRVGHGLLDALLALPKVDDGEEEDPDAWFEWWNDIYLVDDPDPECVLEGILAAESTSLLGAKPKIGKSVWARCLAYHVLKGLDFCGRKVRQGPVLYLSLEDRRRSVKKHFKQLGLLEQPGFALRFGHRPDDLIERLRTALERHHFVLVVIDTLFKGLDFQRDNDYAEAKRLMEPVEQLARTSGAHIMMTHHLSKVERGGGDDFLGSTALFGNVDTGILMKKREVGRTLQTIQRESDLEDLEETIVSYDKETGLVSFGGTLAEVRTSGAKEAILKRLGDKQRSEQDIKDGIKMDAILISETLDAMVEAGELVRSGRGVSRHPYMYHNPLTYKPEPPPEPADISAKREQKQAEAQKTAAATLVVDPSHGGWPDLVKAWVSLQWGTPSTAEIYERALVLGTFVWPEDMSERGRHTLLGEELSRLAKDGTLSAPCGALL